MIAKRQAEFLAWISRCALAEDAVLAVITGDACPCTNKTGSYDAQWHRDNPEPDDEDCGGTELIDTTTTTTNIKAFFYWSNIRGNVLAQSEGQYPIGEREEKFLVMIGTLKTSDNTFQTLDGLNERQSYVTYDGNRYRIKEVTDLHYAEMIRLEPI